MVSNLRIRIHQALTSLAYWQIITLGIVTTLAAILVVNTLAGFAYAAAGRENFTWLLVAHLVAGCLVGWFVPSPFIDAYLSRRAIDAYTAAWRHLLDELASDDEPCEEICEQCEEICEREKDPNA